jgi:hypothetical protein
MECKAHGSISSEIFSQNCSLRNIALHILRRNSVHKVATVSDKKIYRNKSIAKDVRKLENPRVNETAYHITKQEVDELFRLESCPCDLQTAMHNVFYLLEINVKKEGTYVRHVHGKQHGQS